MLENLIPDENIPSAAQVLNTLENSNDIMEEDRALIAELFESLEVAHSELASACSTLSRLSRKLRPQQLMVVLQASTWPLIQVNAATALLEAPARKHELPDDQHERIKLLMIPDPTVKLLKTEKINSPMRLLATTWAFRILNTFGKGTTQRNMQESYSMQAKQLAACITGRKYLGGSDIK